MKIDSRQSQASQAFFGCLVLLISSCVGAASSTLFDHCLTELSDNPHHIFSSDDVRGLQGDPRFQSFVSRYDRYTPIRDPLSQNLSQPSYAKDSSSALIGNAFLRWTALNGGELTLPEMGNSELEQALYHINYLEYTFYPQVMTRTAFSPDGDTAKMIQLSILRNDILLEIESRNSILVRGVVAGATAASKSALWVLGNQYDKISHVSWDSSGRYVMCLGYRGDAKKILMYTFDAATLTLSLCAEMTVALEGFPEFDPTHLLWGPDGGIIIVGGNSPDRRRSITFSYAFSPARNTISPLRMIQKVSGEQATARQAFWFADMSRLCVVRAGECAIFKWDKFSLSFTLERVVYPGLNHVVSASLSHDMNYFLTEHAEAPYLRITKPGLPLGVYSYAQFVDKLADPQWNPKNFHFVARSRIESDVIVLHEYNPALDQVVVCQRIHVGAGITSMKWAPDGSYLFVSGDASLSYGSGIRVYAFDGKQLDLCNSFDDVALGTTMVTEAAFLPSKNTLVLAGKAGDFASGVVCSLASSLRKKDVMVTSEIPLVDCTTSAAMSQPVSQPAGPHVVYQYLDEVPTEQDVVFGSVLMLANAEDTSRGLAVCDAPEVRCANNGKPFPCARTVRQGDISGEFLSSWWIVEGESWLERLDQPIKPFAQISLKNLLTGARLCFTSEHAPVNGTAADRSFVGLASEDRYLSIGHADGSCAPWRVGDAVQLRGKEGCIAVSDTPSKHPILQKMGISRLAVPHPSQERAPSSLWVVSRNIPLSRIFSQAIRGSECCDFLLKRIDALWGEDLKAVVTGSLKAAMDKGI